MGDLNKFRKALVEKKKILDMSGSCFVCEHVIVWIIVITERTDRSHFMPGLTAMAHLISTSASLSTKCKTEFYPTYYLMKALSSYMLDI